MNTYFYFCCICNMLHCSLCNRAPFNVFHYRDKVCDFIDRSWSNEVNSGSSTTGSHNYFLKIVLEIYVSTAAET